MNNIENDNKTITLIYQVGKVGSSSIFQSLKELNIENLYQVHNIAKAEELLNKENRLGYKNGMHHFEDGLKVKALLEEKKFDKIKIIVGVREPISRWISDIFQNLDERYSFLLGNHGEVDIKKTIEYINSTLYDEDFMHWFEDELLKTFNINLFDFKFDKQKGYSIINDNNVEVFIYKLEKLDSLEVKLKDFLEVDNFSLIKANNTNDKSRSEFYSLIKTYLNFDLNFLKEYYSQKLITHFYSQEEIEGFIKRWINTTKFPKELKELEYKAQIQYLNFNLEQKKIKEEKLKNKLEEQRKIIQQKNQELKVLNKQALELQAIYSSKKYKLANVLAYPYAFLKKVLKG